MRLILLIRGFAALKAILARARGRPSLFLASFEHGSQCLLNLGLQRLENRESVFLKIDLCGVGMVRRDVLLVVYALQLLATAMLAREVEGEHALRLASATHHQDCFDHWRGLRQLIPTFFVVVDGNQCFIDRTAWLVADEIPKATLRSCNFLARITVHC